MSRHPSLHYLPVVAVLGDRFPFAAVLFSALRKWGVPRGLLRAGNSAGDGILIASGDRLAIVAQAMGAALRLPWVHAAAASLRDERADALPRGLAGFDVWRRYREVGTELSLEGGFEGFLSRLRPRSRRNYRYFRRRAEAEMDVSFVPNLGREDAVRAVTQLHGVGMQRRSRRGSLWTEATVRQTPGSFAMGLRTPDGRWLSFLAGWRRADATYVEFQLNDHRHPAASLSTVMRTYLIEHETARGAERIVFVGGSTDALGRYCAPISCLDLLAVRKGLRGQAARMLAQTFSPGGHTATMLRDSPILRQPALWNNADAVG